MNKAFCTFFLVLCGIGVSAQWNPVKNLTWSHWYDMPNNYYSLSWDAPDPFAGDTLVGYNVYRNGVLWRFQAGIGVQCTPAGCPDPGFLMMDPFWISVKVVYNIEHVESAAVDSIQDLGIMIGIRDQTKENFHVSPNPVAPGEVMTITLPDLTGNIEIRLFNTMGAVIRKWDTFFSGRIVRCNTAGLDHGLYYLVCTGSGQQYMTKVIVQ